MKQFIRIIIIFSITYLIGCKQSLNIIIEDQDISNFNKIYGLNVFEFYSDELDYITISGFLDKDSYNYKDIEIKNNKQNKIILMYAEYSIDNENNKIFNINIPIEKNINKVFFGNNKTLIWERKSIEILNNREKILEIKKYMHYEDIIKQFGKPEINNISGYKIFIYTLNNNRRAVLNFVGGNDRILKLTEEIIIDQDRIQNIIFE